MEKLLGEKQPRKAAALFGKYRLLRPLKRSPFLENYLAQEESPPHTTVVLKRLHPLVIHRTDWVSLFLDEAKQAATLWHPNILRIYDLGVIDGVPYFVQPYLFGKKLQTLLARSRSLPIPTGMALLLIRQLLEALQFSHSLGGRSGRPISHGGLHPERIFIGYDGVVGIGDFGLGWLEDPRSAIRSRYRAPESISEKKGGEIPGGTPGEDLFAASAILCELLGEFPEPVKADMQPWGYLPASIRSILVRGLAIDPVARFQTAGEMIAPIESILQGEYPRLNLTNYIQAFFGKEIEAERRAFMRFAPTEGEGVPSGEPFFFERLEPPTPLAPQPVPAISPEPFQEPAPPAVSAVVETVVSLPAISDPTAGETVAPPQEVVPEKKASWQPIWWGLFGLLMTGFVGVLFFSLYRSSPDQIASAPTAPSPVITTRPDPIDSPASAVEENIEGKESALPPEEEIAPPLSTAAQPISPEPSAPAQAAVGEAIKTPPPDGKSEQNQIKKTTVLSASKSDPSSTPMSPPPVAPPDASRAAAKISPKLREGLPPQPKVEEIPAGAKSNEDLLHELIERQRRAYQSQDWALSRQDVADGSAFEGQIAELFGGVEPIRVEFQVFGLKVRGDEADLSLMQTARVRKGKGVSLQKSLLFWKLKKEKERWKIEKFNVIEKYPPIEVG
ncbi:MAG: protein kinase [Candidatus Manganitrophus sp. SA1]|nr:protein kinase [Candidatus Manganitrophus morganii]